MTEFEVYVPNLDRRTDRWHLCLGALIALDYPAERIHRFAAYDGDDYKKARQARVAAVRRHPNCVYLKENKKLTKHYFCWAWTWYEIMLHITRQPENTYHLISVDDRIIKMRYSQIGTLISGLRGAKVIQFQVSPQRIAGAQPVEPNPIPDQPFQQAIAPGQDASVIFTPSGARAILEVAEYPDLGIPYGVFWRAATVLNHEGYYSSVTHTVRSLNKNHHVNQFDDGRQSDEL